MNTLEIILCSLLGILVIIIVIVVVRTIRFKPTITEVPAYTKPKDLDSNRIIESFQNMVKFKTISSYKWEEVDNTQFVGFRKYLVERYPLVNSKCKLDYIGPNGVVYYLKGKEPGEPAVIMSHYDVVEVGTKWLHDPFGAEIIDGVIWGRGTIDNKCTLLGAMEGLEYLLKNNYVPQHDLYLCFAGDEEVNGLSAPAIVDWFEKKNIHPRFVLDEGGAIVTDIFPGVSKKCAVIGIAEKGICNITLKCTSHGGHSSTPLAHTPLGRVAAAMSKVENSPFKYHMTGATAAMFDTLGRYSEKPIIKVVFANLWLFMPVLKLIAKKSPEIGAMLHTTTAVTMAYGSTMPNVISTEAGGVINFRIISGETVESIKSRLTKIINDPTVDIGTNIADNPSVVSRIDTPEYKELSETISQVFGDVIVSPYLMMAASDSRHYSRISDKVYRFSVLEMTKEQRGSIHGDNESIEIEKVKLCVEFYINMMSKL